MLKLSGEEQFDRPPDELWRSLADPRFLCTCFPGVESIERADERSATVRVRPAFSFIRGALDVLFEFVETDAPRHARVAIRLKGIGSSAELEAAMVLTLERPGTRVQWSAETRSFGGLLKAVPQGLLQAAAQKVAADTWAAILQKLSRG